MTNNIICGIDIGSDKVSTIIAKYSESEGDVEPRVLGFARATSRGVKRGQIVDINQVSAVVEESVEKAERMAGTKIDAAFISVGGPHVESQNSQGVVAVSQPDIEISAEDMTRVIEAAKAISLSSTREVIEVIPREYIVDGQAGIKNPLGMSGVRLEVNTHIITASLINLKNLERCLSDLGIQTLGHVFSALASSYSTLSETEKELGVVLVDIGAGKIDMCMYVDGALSYSSSVGIGARFITNDIAVGLRISLDSAEKIKLFLNDERVIKKVKEQKIDEVNISHLGIPEELKSVSYKMVVEGIIRPRLEEIFEKVLIHIEDSGYASQIPAGLVITGGGAQTIGTLDAAKRVIGLPARIGFPGKVTGLIDEVMYPQYASVVGLLLYAKGASLTEQKMNFKDFDKILRNISIKGSAKKVKDLFKSFMP